jgi:hypothetical protein
MHWLSCNPTLRALEHQRQLLGGARSARPVAQPAGEAGRAPARPVPTAEERAAMAVLDTQAPLPPVPPAGR